MSYICRNIPYILSSDFSLMHTLYTECFRMNLPYVRRTFLRLIYIDIKLSHHYLCNYSNLYMGMFGCSDAI
jgi:hypothetical protein